MASSLSATKPLSQIHEEIEALFSWNPRRLVNAPLHKKTSTASATRLPGFYDKHFSDSLILRRVKRLPSLVQQLADNVDTALLATLDTLPHVDNFITAKHRWRDVANVCTTASDERGVAEYYLLTAARFCAPVASTLALHPNAPFSAWLSLLKWSQSANTDGHEIVEGFLRFFPEEIGDGRLQRLKASMAEAMEPKIRRLYEVFQKSSTPLATWEIKGLAASPNDVLTEVPNLGEFMWTKCTDAACHTGTKHHTQRKRVTLAMEGHDAKRPPWSIDVCSFFLNNVPQNGPLCGAQGSDDGVGMTEVLSSIPFPQTPSKRPRTRSTTDSAVPPPPPPIVNAKGNTASEKGNTKSGKRKRNDEDEACEDDHDVTAQSLVQRAWAQSVEVDGSIIILHSGNYELVCLRHRQTQTLYVSELVTPSSCRNPGYGKLQVGIYLAAIQDAADRLEQSSPYQPQPPGDETSDLDEGSTGTDKDSDKYRTGRKASATHKGTISIEKTTKAAIIRDIVFLYLQYGVYDSPTPSTFLRSIVSDSQVTPSPSLRPISSYQLEECLTIVLTSEIARGATGVVHRGTLEAGISDAFPPLDVVVKLSFSSEQRDALQSEYATYSKLALKAVLRGITRPIGFFIDSEGGPYALVLPYAGVSLAMSPERVLTTCERESALDSLRSIHGAGILHGDIRKGNILVGDIGVTIIDFAYSKECNQQSVKDKELRKLRCLLDSQDQGG